MDPNKKVFNLASWSMAHKALVYFFMVLFSIAGILAYFSLGRMEDPDYTIRQMVVTTSWPGATAEQVETQLTDRLEKRLQDLEGLDKLQSYSLPGQSTIIVELKDTTKKADIAGKWTEARNLVQQETANLPKGVEMPVIDDHFDSVYGMIFALTAEDGYTWQEMKDAADSIRQSILSLPQTKKVELIGVQTKCLYVDADMNRMAMLGIGTEDIKTMVQAENTVTESGNSVGQGILPIRVKDTVHSLEELKQLTLKKNGRIVRLGDFATIRESYLESGEPKFFYQGRPAIGIAVSMSSGQNVLTFGDALKSLLVPIVANLPAGMELHQSADQAANVEAAIFTFVRSLVEALVIIFAVSLFSLGRKAGVVVVLCIPFVLAVTFSIMYLMKIDLQSVSLGGLIIGLGLMVDDAMIVVEMIMVKLEEGWEKSRAVVHAFEVTAVPMLTGTLITCAGFIPVAFATGSASEFCSSLFYVITISLLVSWVTAGVVTPLLGYHFIDLDGLEKKKGRMYDWTQRFYGWFWKKLEQALNCRKKILVATGVLFLLSCFVITQLQQEFFPASSRPELILRMELPVDSSYTATEQQAAKLSSLLEHEESIDHYSYTVGTGAPRFVLTFDPAQDKPNLAEFLIVTKSLADRKALQEKLQQIMDQDFPETVYHTMVLITGSSAEYPVMLRVQGPEMKKVREISAQVAKKMRQHPQTRNVRENAGEEMMSLQLKTSDLQSRQIGVTAQSLASDVRRYIEGETISNYQEGEASLPIMLHLRGSSNHPLDDLRQLPINLIDGSKAPLGQVAEPVLKPEAARIYRRNRLKAIQVCAEVKGPDTGEDVTQQIYDNLSELRGSLPPGYSIELDGALQDSNNNTAAFLAPVPIMVMIILVLLMFQLQSIPKVMITLLTAPLGIIGIAAGLLLTGRPFGFVVLMGMLALFGIIIRNSVILIDQIECHRREGEAVQTAILKASVSRLRPIMLTAMAAVLAMIPLTGNALWGPMAVAMGAGLMVATVLTLIVLPVMYAVVYCRE